MATKKPVPVQSKKKVVQVETVQAPTTTRVHTGVAFVVIGALAFLAFGFFSFSLSGFNSEQANQMLKVVGKNAPSLEEKMATLTRNLFASPTTEDYGPQVQTRQAALLALAASNPAAAQQHVLAAETAKQLPATVQASLEQEGNFEGTLEALIFDGQNLSTSYQELYLLQNGVRHRVFAPSVDTYDGLANKKVTVHGFKIDDENILLAAGDESVTPATTETTTTTTATTKKVAIILYNFVNDTRQPTTAEAMRSSVFTASNSVNAFISEVSFGKVGLAGKTQIDGDILGWYTLPSTYNSSTQVCTSYYRTWSDAARQMAAAAGNDMSGYDHFMYVFPRPPSTCPAWSWAEINGDETWNNDLKTNVLAHEFGHNLGATHASTYTCTDTAGARTTLSTNCTLSEYGDIFDDMGSVYRQYNNRIRNIVGWFAGGNVQTVSASGIYTLYPVEKSHGSTQAIVIARNRNSAGQVAEQYWLEFRQPYGFDTFGTSDPVVNGVSLRLAPVPGVGGGLSGNTLLLDAVPVTSGFEDAALTVGQVFEDTAYGIRFATTEVTTDHATIDIQFTAPPCVTAPPTATLTPAAGTYGYAGQGLNYYLNVTNRDNANCALSTFAVTPTLPTGWSQTPTPLSFTLAPGATRQTVVTIVSEAAAAANVYALSELVTNTTSALSTTVTGTYTVTGPDLTAPTVKISSPATGSTLRGKNVKINTSASDVSGIAKLEILIDGVSRKVCLGTTSCSYTALLSSIGSGVHSITARATDKSVSANVGSAEVIVKKK